MTRYSRPPSSLRAALTARQTPRPAAQPVHVYRPEHSVRSNEVKRAALAYTLERLETLCQTAVDEQERAYWKARIAKLKGVNT